MAKPSTALLRRADVQRRTTLSKTTIYRMVKDGRFPRPIHLGSCRAVAWLEEDIENWLADKIASRP